MTGGPPMTDWESKELLCRSMSGRLFFCAWLLVGRAHKEVFGDAGGRLPDYWSGLERTGAARHEAGALAEKWGARYWTHARAQR